jgi:hypothetical protein
VGPEAVASVGPKAAVALGGRAVVAEASVWRRGGSGSLAGGGHVDLDD